MALFDPNGLFKRADGVLTLNAAQLPAAVETFIRCHPKQQKLGIAAEDGKAYRLDLSSLARFAQIRELELCCRLHPQTDLSPVYALENLHSLRWLPDREIDIARFPHLKNLQTAHAFASLHKPPNYSGTHSFIEQLGGACWYGNWTDGLTAPAAYALDFDETVTDDSDPNGNIRISRDGKPFLQAAAVPAYYYGCNGADWLILFYEPASRTALIMQEWT